MPNPILGAGERKMNCSQVCFPYLLAVNPAPAAPPEARVSGLSPCHLEGTKVRAPDGQLLLSRSSPPLSRADKRAPTPLGNMWKADVI